MDWLPNERKDELDDLGKATVKQPQHQIASIK